MENTYAPKTVLILCSNIPLTQLTAKSIQKIPNIEVIKRTDYQDAQYILQNRYIDLIIQCPSGNHLLRDNIVKREVPNITLITNQNNHLIKECFQTGTTHIMAVPFKPFHLELLTKNILGLIRLQKDKEVKYHNLTLLPHKNILRYREIKIFLNENEKQILKIIMEKETEVDIDEIYEYMRKISKNQIYTIISKLNKKFRKHTGLKLIKNRYGVGYRIAF